MDLNSKYKPLWSNNYDYAIITGGRGSQKSFAVGDFIENLTFEDGHTILFTRYTLTSAHISVIPEFVEKIELEKHEKYFEVNKTDIVNKNTGSNILFRGIKTSSGVQTASLKSIQNVSTWVLDEAEELQDESIFDKIDESIRVTHVKNRVILILNPATKEHFIYQRFFQNKGIEAGFNGIKDNVLYIHTDYRDNLKHLSTKFLNNIAKSKIERPEYYNHIILGGWLDKAEGVIFNNWSIGKFDNNLDYGYGLDFGYSIDPDALTKIAIDKHKKIIYLHEEVYTNGLSTTELSKRLERCGNKPIVADSAEPRLINDLQLKRSSINIIKAHKPNGSIGNGIRIMQDYQIIITAESINIHKEFNNYVWNDKKSGIPVDNYNHAIDGIRYYCMKFINKGNWDIYY